MNPKFLTIRGARQNNLKNLTVQIPHQALTVVTGPSGAGKSSLAFETIFAEGQRLYIESLSTYARQFLEKVERPDVDAIENICPTIAIEQKNTVKNSRATVATTTELYDYLRLLFAKIGMVICPTCNSPIQKDSISSIVDTVLKKLDGQKILVIAPFKSRASTQKELLKNLLKKGFTRILLDKKLHELKPTSISVSPQTEIWVVLVRQVVSSKIKGHLTDSLEIAYQETR